MESSFLGYRAGDAMVVTGGGSGIGRDTALIAARAGVKVAVWDLGEHPANESAAAINAEGGNAIAIALDAANREAVAAAWATTVEQLGPIAYLAAIAGPPSFGASDFMDGVAKAIDCMRVPTETWPALPDCRRSAVYLSSVQGPRYGAGTEWYTVAKSAIDGYMRAQAAVGEIRANAVLPDWIYTPRTQKYVDEAGGMLWADNPMGRIGMPVDVANLVVFLLSPAASYLNGTSIPVDGGAGLKSNAWLKMQEARQ